MKEFYEYIEIGTSNVSYEGYLINPGTEFLKYVVDANDAVEYCQNNFKKNADGSYNKDSNINLKNISAAMLPAIMGHFETFQITTFALLFEFSRFINGFSEKEFFSKLTKSNVQIDLIRLAAFRGQNASVGLLLADNLKDWHNPHKVNEYFSSFDLNNQFYNKSQITNLQILWQLRHSIVHTGGWLTRPDAQKIKQLNIYANKPLLFNDSFIREVARKIHPIIKDVMKRLQTAFENKIILSNIPKEEKDKIDKYFKIESRYNSWLK